MIGVDTYRYGFEANAEKVYREWLYVKAGKKRSKEIELFYREENKYELHPRFSIGRNSKTLSTCQILKTLSE